MKCRSRFSRSIVRPLTKQQAAHSGTACNFHTVRLTSTTAHRRFLHSQLNPGSPAAHRRVRLVLLRSRPDTVHRDLLRRTQTSTPLMKRCSADKKPRFGITPAVADCRYRAPLSPRLHGNHNYTDSASVCQTPPDTFLLSVPELGPALF